MISCDVLIIGAGPTGLALAGMLSQAGVSVRIVDKITSRSGTSRALGVQAGTLEAIEDVFGADVVQEMIAGGVQTNRIYIHLDDKKPVEVDLRIPGRYNSILILSQSETERILEQQLKVKVEYGLELVSLNQDEKGCVAKVTSGDGRIEIIESQYVVGCDGAHSVVRHQVNIPFADGQYEGEFVLGDLQATWPWDGSAAVRIFISKNGALAAFPMKGERRYRLILIPKGSGQNEKSDLSLPEFQSLVDSLTAKSIVVSDPTWMTRFRVSRRTVARLRQERVFLAGDAAHIHSPAGGHGMNAGIQDSFNLASKLIPVLHRGAGQSLLDRYEKERLPVARKILHATDIAFRLGILPENRLMTTACQVLLPRLVGNRFVQRMLARTLFENVK